MTTFENNGMKISKNIVKLNLNQNTNLYCTIIWSPYVPKKHIFDKPARWDWELTLKQFKVKGHNWVSLRYYDFNLYLVITRLVHKFKFTEWLQGHLSLPSFWNWSNEYQKPQKGVIKFYIYIYIYTYIYLYIYIHIHQLFSTR